MKMLPVRSRIVVLVGAMVLAFQLAPAQADADREKSEDHDRRVLVTFTKWLLALGPNPGYMQGVTGGHVEGVFFGETFVNVARANPAIPGLSTLEVIYSVQANDPDRSFTALIRGGAALGKAQLDGRILAGWRIGAPVHVEWVRFPSPSADCPAPPVNAGAFCFVGTITIDR
jgi:hypothetical protein